MGQVEDEFHFLCICTNYGDLREALYIKAARVFPAFRELDELEKFVYLLNNFQRHVIIYLNDAVYRRRSSLFNSWMYSNDSHACLLYWFLNASVTYKPNGAGWFCLILFIYTSWSSGRVQDSGLGSRSSPGFNTLPVRLLVVPLSKALHAALLLSTQEEMGTCEGRFVSRGPKLRVSGCILPRELRWLSIRIWTVKGPMTREGTCQSLQSRDLSLDVDSKQWLYLYFTLCICISHVTLIKIMLCMLCYV